MNVFVSTALAPLASLKVAVLSTLQSWKEVYLERWGSLLLEYSVSTCKALGLIPSTFKKKRVLHNVLWLLKEAKTLPLKT